MQYTKKAILLDSDTISRRVKDLGREISAKYPEGNIVLVGILKGAFVFMADLARSLQVSCEIDFARISSYGSGTVSSGELKIIMDVTAPIKDKHVIIVDDIVDTGLTLNRFRKLLEERSPRSVEIAALLDKTARRQEQVQVDYCGFTIEDGFVVGYGLDCDEQYRYLDSVYVLEQ